MNLLKQATRDAYSLKLARAALYGSRDEVKAIREHIRQQHGADVLEAVDSEWPFAMLGLIEQHSKANSWRVG